MKPFIRPTISVVLIVLSVLGMLNVYNDNSEVELIARRTACSHCEPSSLRLAVLNRTPISQTFHFELTDSPATNRTQAVSQGLQVIECSRSAVFIGDYSCTKQ